MKTDVYTKIVLTVIASCLVYLVAKDMAFVGSAEAQSRSPIEVNIVEVAGYKFSGTDISSGYPALPVKVKQ